MIVVSRSVPISLRIDDSRFDNNYRAGVRLYGGVAATITRSIASGNTGHGFVAEKGASLLLRSSVAANNGSTGFLALGSSEITVEDSVARGNAQAGLYIDTAATGVLSGSVVSNNGQAGVYNMGTFLSRGNNTAAGNGVQDVIGTVTPLPGT